MYARLALSLRQGESPAPSTASDLMAEPERGAGEVWLIPVSKKDRTLTNGYPTEWHRRERDAKGRFLSQPQDAPDYRLLSAGDWDRLRQAGIIV